MAISKRSILGLLIVTIPAQASPNPQQSPSLSVTKALIVAVHAIFACKLFKGASDKARQTQKHVSDSKEDAHDLRKNSAVKWHDYEEPELWKWKKAKRQEGQTHAFRPSHPAPQQRTERDLQPAPQMGKQPSSAENSVHTTIAQAQGLNPWTAMNNFAAHTYLSPRSPHKGYLYSKLYVEDDEMEDE